MQNFVLATILNFCPFLPSPQSLSPSWSSLDKIYHLTEPLPTCLSTRDETKNWPTRSILLSHPYPLFFPAFFPFHFLLAFLQSSFPRKLIKTASGDETAKLEYRNRRVESCNSFQPNGTTHVRFRESSFLQIR